MNPDLNVIDELFNIAKSSKPVARARVAAGLVHKSLPQMVIAQNSRKTHPFQAKYSSNEDAICLHAETSVVVKALKLLSVDDLRKSKLYVVRAKKIGGVWTTGLAKPCEGCQRCLTSFGIKNVWFTQEPVAFL